MFLMRCLFCGTISDSEGRQIMQIYNSNLLDHGKRFYLAIAAGLLSALVLGIVYGLISSVLRVQASIIFIGCGWCIGEVIRRTGRGVGTKFSILGALCTLLCILIGDVTAMTGFKGLFLLIIDPSGWLVFLRAWAAMFLSTNINALLGLIMRAAGVYFGYTNSAIY